MGDSAELEQLRELIELFPSEFALDEVEEANRITRTRFDAMDNELVPLVSSMAQNTAKFGVKDYIKFCRTFHSIIFKDIISINGEKACELCQVLSYRRLLSQISYLLDFLQ